MKAETIVRGNALKTLPLVVALTMLGACDNSSFYTVLGNKILVVLLSISPATALVPANGSTTFSASGGVPPYSFSITSGPGTINASSGVYTAPASPGVAIVQVKDKQGSTATAVVNPVNYAITAMSNPGGQFSGGTASGTFTIKNQGSSSGTQTIFWTVYASPTPALGAGSSVIQSGTTGALGSPGTTTVTYSGVWPAPSTPTTYYVIASISSADSAGASLASAAFSISPAQVDYAISALTFTSVATTTPGTPMNGSFQLTNNGPNPGTQNVSWQAYASATPSLAGSTLVIASGTTPPLAATNSSIVNFGGTWPATPGYNYLVVVVSVLVDQDTAPANNMGAVFDAALTDPANNNFATATSMGITLQPGMTIAVTGNLTSTNLDDFLSFNAGNAASVTFSIAWAGAAASVMLSIYAPPGPPALPLPPGSASGSSSPLLLTWPVLATDSNQLRYIDVNNAGGAPGIYTMIIKAN
ncbi:MAG TPA: hypothetical protein VMU36_02770 [Spirochaetia bacterium]|nr:hypothetical protein [Spirochaetia bacterium]